MHVYAVHCSTSLHNRATDFDSKATIPFALDCFLQLVLRLGADRIVSVLERPGHVVSTGCLAMRLKAMWKNHSWTIWLLRNSPKIGVNCFVLISSQIPAGGGPPFAMPFNVVGKAKMKSSQVFWSKVKHFNLDLAQDSPSSRCGISRETLQRSWMILNVGSKGLCRCLWQLPHAGCGSLIAGQDRV